MVFPIPSSHKALLNEYQIKNISITCWSIHESIRVVQISAKHFRKRSVKNLGFVKKE